MEPRMEYAHIVKAVAFCAAAFAMSIGSIGPALAQGMIGKEACNATAKSPESSKSIFKTMITGLALVETCAIYNLVISILILMWAK
jgi:F-type H+-transporting ATPase subunit c